MIGNRLHGRLGNQLFQYAFIFSASKKLNTSFFIDHYLDTFVLDKYFETKAYSSLKNKIRNSFYQRFLSKKWSVSTENKDFSTHNITKKLKNSHFYDGYFQSSLYFEEEEIKREFKITEKWISKFNTEFKTLFDNNKTLVIHIRLTDYTEVNNHMALPIEYYKKALLKVKDITQYQIIVVSDDINLAKEKLKIKDALYCQNKMIIDFQLVMNADALIIANSSFSWWAAYLNQKKEKLIIAPKNWMGYNKNECHPPHILKNLSWQAIV